jgi:hypothetical protein
LQNTKIGWNESKIRHKKNIRILHVPGVWVTVVPGGDGVVLTVVPGGDGVVLTVVPGGDGVVLTVVPGGDGVVLTVVFGGDAVVLTETNIDGKVTWRSIPFSYFSGFKK